MAPGLHERAFIEMRRQFIRTRVTLPRPMTDAEWRNNERTVEGRKINAAWQAAKEEFYRRAVALLWDGLDKDNGLT